MEPIKKIKTTNLHYAHVMADGTVKLFYRKRIAEARGKEFEWSETAAQKIPVRVCYGGIRPAPGLEFAFKSVFIYQNAVKLLANTDSIDIWPDNSSDNLKAVNASRMTIILACKNYRISFDSYRINGKDIDNCDVSLCF